MKSVSIGEAWRHHAGRASQVEVNHTGRERAKLRRFLLELAAQGKLYPCGSSRERLTLGDLGEWGSGGTPLKAHAEYYGGNIPWLVIGDLNDGLVQKAGTNITPAGLANSSAKLIEPGTILIAMYGSIGKLGIAGFQCATNQAIAHCVPNEKVIHQYLFLLLRSLRDHLLAQGQGVAQQNISQKILKAYSVLVPGVEEQHRIVAKVEKLMALCDQWEAARAQREATRDRLAAANLARLNTPDPATFPADARFALDALLALTTRPDQIKQLRQTILNLAVRGKLVPQDEREPKASEICLQDVAGRLDISIPQCWRWARVAEVAQARLGKMLDKAKNKGLFYRYLRNTNVHWFEIRTDDLKSIPLSSDELEEYRLQPGDVLICEGGHGIGRAAVWREKLSNIVFQKALHRVRSGSSLDPDFFSYCCFVYFDAGVMQSYFTGVGIPHFTGKGLSRLVIPIPPIAEQHRIVAKVEELMALCDQLEANLTNGETTRRRLLDALLHEALAPVSTPSSETPRAAVSG